MSKVSQDERGQLVFDLSRMGSSGRAEGESSATFAKTFLPIPEHARVFDPDVVLIVGQRGAGKSEIFRAVVQEDLLDAILARIPSIRIQKLDKANATWMAGYPLEKLGPDDISLRTFISSASTTPEDRSIFWFAYLARLLLKQENCSEFKDLSDLHGAKVGEIVRHFKGAQDVLLRFLDDLDTKLEKKDRWIFISYDELDTLGGSDWDAMVKAVHGLIAFWASYNRRWKRLRPKVFLRTDLFRRHGQVLGADLSKLAANRAEISWNDRNLYAMLVKRIANASERLSEYCQRSRIQFETDPVLGLIPIIPRAEDARPLVERLAGQFMGAERKKGSTFRWILSHVRDGNDRAMPRALVRLIEKAAQEEQDVGRATHSRLLAPASLRRALDGVSQDHVTELSTGELPWLHGVAERLKGHGSPMQRREAENILCRDWERSWGRPPNVTRPPVDKADALVDYLVEIGVFRERQDRRIDIPDLFLAGLGMTRKGGVARR